MNLRYTLYYLLTIIYYYIFDFNRILPDYPKYWCRWLRSVRS